MPNLGGKGWIGSVTSGEIPPQSIRCSGSVSSSSHEVSPVNKIFAPWDLLRGRDVFKHSELLEEETQEAELVHYAPNCATFSRAREIPIKGVKNCPKPLRSPEFPEGIPGEVDKLSRKGIKRLKDDTRMADLSADGCYRRAERGLGFTLEHPGNSLARHLPSWIKLVQRRDVHEIFYHTCRFEGSRRRKFRF